MISQIYGEKLQLDGERLGFSSGLGFNSSKHWRSLGLGDLFVSSSHLPETALADGHTAETLSGEGRSPESRPRLGFLRILNRDYPELVQKQKPELDWAWGEGVFLNPELNFSNRRNAFGV